MPTKQTALLALGLALAAASALQAQAGASFGPKEIYLRGSALAWQFAVEQSSSELFDAAAAVAEEQGMAVSLRDAEAGLLRLIRTDLAGKKLDKLCRYPIVGYYKWKPVESFAMAQARGMRQRVRGESTVEAALLRGSVHVSVRVAADGTCTIQSLCSAYLRDWGLLEASSRGVLEKPFVEQLTARLGRPTEVQLPPPGPEPARTNPSHDLETARVCLENCRPGRPCPGMYVDPETRELRCVAESPAPTG